VKHLLQLILELLAKLYLWRYRPFIVAVTGNVGKTSTKEAIAAVLRKERRIRVSHSNLNNETGIPLTIIGNWSKYHDDYGSNIIFRIIVAASGVFGLIFSRYPQILVLEYGADRPGDIYRLVKKYKPYIGVVTAVGEVPVHVEFFSGPAALANEKSKLVSTLSSSDFAVLNFDDLAVLDMKDKTKARVFTYGFGQGARVN